MRISDEDIASVRERSPIAAIIGEYVALRPAGGGELKGLCPFHEEKTPSFHVTPDRGLYHCFGCGEGGDNFGFVMKIEHLSFAESVEKLAARAGVELRYEQAGPAAHGHQGRRSRLVEANKAAVAFYSERLHTDPTASVARTYLTDRGFDTEAAKAYDVGYSPDAWDALTKHLLAAGFTTDELTTAGLASPGQRGLVDRFRNRLMFPIFSNTGEPIGFGARKLDETKDGPKYLNTPETPLYKKSHVLYGLNKARVEIGRRSQAVVVEGYTDVMSCHLAGVPTAVATCGTALTADHISTLRLLLMDQDEFRGEVVFTFDGDSAGQRAAIKAFAEDARFVTQTFVAVEPDGKDPCELRMSGGDAAVRDLIARRVPLYEFYVRSTLSGYDLESPEGRIRGLAATAPVVAQIRDHGLRLQYVRQLAGWLGMDPEEIRRRVSESAGGTERKPGRQQARPVQGQAALPGTLVVEDNPTTRVEREALKAVLQSTAVVGPIWDDISADLFTAAPYAAVRDAVAAAGGVAALGADGMHGFVARVRDAAPDDAVRALVTELAVEPSHAGTDATAYARAVLARLQELGLQRRIQELKSRLQRLNPIEEAEYNRLFAELIAMEARARALREHALGALA